MPRPKKEPPGGGSWTRFEVKLSPADLAILNRLRGKYLTDTGRDVSRMATLRVALKALSDASWTEVRKLLDAEGN